MLFRSVRKLGFQSGKLAYIGPLLGIGGKVKNEGFELWLKVMAGNEAAQMKHAEGFMNRIDISNGAILKLKMFGNKWDIQLERLKENNL